MTKLNIKNKHLPPCYLSHLVQKKALSTFFYNNYPFRKTFSITLFFIISRIKPYVLDLKITASQAILQIMVILSLTFFLIGCAPSDTTDFATNYFYKGQEAIDRRDFESAIVYFNYLVNDENQGQAIKQASTFFLALSHYHLHEFSQAKKYFNTYLHPDNGFFSNISSLIKSQSTNQDIVHIYLSHMQQKTDEVKEKIQSILNQKEDFYGYQISEIIHILQSMAFCGHFRDLDTMIKKQIKKNISDAKSYVIDDPRIALSGVECLIVHGDNANRPEGESWQQQALTLIKEIDSQTIPLSYNKIIQAYRLTLEEINLIEKTAKISEIETELVKRLDEHYDSLILTTLVRIWQLQNKTQHIARLIEKNRKYFTDNIIDQYNYASYLSVAGQQKESLQALTRSIDLGFRDLDHIMNDPDLNNIRNSQQFTAILDRYFPQRETP